MLGAMKSRSIARIGTLLATLAPCALTGCGHGGGGGGGDGGPGPAQTPAQADVLLGGVPADGLLSFTAGVDSIRLQREDGSFSPDLAGSMEVEFIGLGETQELVAHAQIDPGTYTGVEVGFVPDSYRAVADDGTELTIQSSADGFLSRLAEAMTVGEDGYASFSVTLDLAGSLSGKAGDGTLAFSPTGTGSSDDGTERKPIDDVAGKLVSADERGQSLVIEAYARGGHELLGELRVLTAPETLFLDADGMELDAMAFFAALVPGTSWLEIQGELGTGGEVSATRIDLTDRGGPGPDGRVRIDGIVLMLERTGLMLQVREIASGEEIAEPVLDMLADRSVLDVTFDELVPIFLEGRPADAGILKVGQEVTVEFCDFVMAPFPACRIEVRGLEAEFEGTLTDTAGLPDSVLVRLDPEDPAVRGGLVPMDTDVRVDLVGSTIRLELRGRPEIPAEELVPGLRCMLVGTLGGTETEPLVFATRIGIYPGRLSKAAVSGVDEASAAFGTEGGEIASPFGPMVEMGAHWIVIDPACDFQGRIASMEEFFRELSATSPVEVDVRGMCTGVMNEIRAYAIRAK